MKKHLFIILILVGLFTILAGLAFDVLFAGIPYQDPTPEMTERYDRNSFVASTIFWIGVITVIVSSYAAFFRMVRESKAMANDENE